MPKSKIVSFPTPTTKQPKKPRNLRDDGRKQVQLDIGTDPKTGKRLRKYFYGKTLKEANAKKEEWIAEQNKPDPATDPNQTVAEWVERWKATYGQSGGYSTSAGRKASCDKVVAHIGSVRLTDVKPMDIQNMANAYAQLSKSSISNLQSTVQHLFEKAVDNEIITKNPCRDIRWLNAGKGTHRYLSKDEILIITEHFSAYRAGLWAVIMLYAGLRRGEALALRWTDIDMNRGTIRVERAIHFERNESFIGSTKTSSSVRTVPITPPLRKALEKIPLPPRSEFVCTGERGQMVTQSIFASSWGTYLRTMTNIINGDTKQPIAPGRRADKDCLRDSPRKEFSIRAHDLRHTFCSMLYDAGVDVKTAQKLMGHATLDVTMRIYTHLSSEKEATSIEKMIAYLKDFEN